MDTSLKLYYFDGQNDMISFPYGIEQAELHDFTVSKTRMGSAPTITGTLEYPSCLDSEWEAHCHFDDIFVIFNNERYYLKATPSSSKSNDKSFYKHDLTFVSESSVLETVYMIDDNENQTQDILYSNNTQYTFFGSIHDFAERINQSMYFSDIGDTCMYSNGVIVPIADRVLNGDGYYVVVDNSVTNTDDVLITLSNNNVNDALKQVFEKFGVPYYFVGKVIHFGDYEAVTETTPTFAVGGVLGAGIESGSLVPYEYGQPNAVLTVNRNNQTKQIYNRCSGTGSDDNIPYYYPNPTPSGTIHHDIEVVSGSTFDADDVRVDDYLKFSNLGNTDALVFVSANSTTDVHLTNTRIYIDDVPYNGGLFVIDFPYDDFGAGSGEYYGVTKTIRVDFPLNEIYSIVGLNFVSEFQTSTHWRLRRPDGVVITGNGRYARAVAAQLQDSNGDFVFGTYSLYLTKEYEPSNTSQAQGWFDLSGLLSDINATSPYLWFGTIASTMHGWKLQSTENMVNPATYGLTIDETNARNGDKIVKVIDKWVVPQTKLMPSCYRLSDGTKRFYPAINYPFSATGYTPNADLGEEVLSGNVENDNYKDDNSQYYDFANPYRRLKQREHIYDFPDIKPSIKGMTNDDDQRIDMFEAFQYDLNDDNSGYYDENGNFNYNHPYFFGLLRPTDSFNLFEHAIDESEMVISMTSGDCAPCEFVISVDKETQKNLVQVNTLGSFTGYDALMRDEDGDVICGRKVAVAPQSFQQNTMSGWVWVALKKDTSTYGDSNMMPFNDGSVTIRPKACTDLNENDGDTFVILHIDMPQAYIEAAEEELTRQIIKSMNDDNSESFNISLKYSRVFLGDNQGLIDLLNENVKVSARYNNTTKEFFVSSYSYVMKPSSPIPEITINGLVETVEELNAAAASGGFVSHLANQISENFEELMMGTGKPFTRIIQQNNTNVTNQIKGDFPTDYVRTKSDLFADYIVMGAGYKQVKTLPKGLEGQVLMMLNGLPTWGNAEAEALSVYVNKISSNFSITNYYTAITGLTFTCDEGGKFLIDAQIQISAEKEASTQRLEPVSAYLSTDGGKTAISSGEVDVQTCDQINISAYVELEKESSVMVFIKCATNGYVYANPSINDGLSNATMLKAIKIG